MNENVMKDLERYLFSNPEFNSRIPTYNDSSDYTTNANSYYDDLARKNKLMKVLALRIWEYEEEMIKRLEQWDKNLEDFPEDVKKLLEKWLEDGTLDHIINDTIFNWKADKVSLDHVFLNVKDFGAKGDGETVDDEALISALEKVREMGGGKIFFPYSDKGYVINNVTTKVSNVEIDFRHNKIYKISGNGYQIRWEGSLNMRNITIRNWHGIGDNTELGNGGVGMALTTETSHIDNLYFYNAKAENFAQYGINIGSVSNINFYGITDIINHGSIADGSTIGIGFVIYPRSTEKNGYIEHLRSEINPKSTLTSAAVKLQIIRNLTVDKIHARGGTEQSVGLDSIGDSVIKDILLETNRDTRHLGMSVSSESNIVGVRDQGFDILKIKAVGDFYNVLTLGRGQNRGINIYNVEAPENRIVATTGAKIDNCIFKNWELESVRLNLYDESFVTNSYFENIKTYLGSISFTGDNNEFKNINCKSLFMLVGDNNKVFDIYSENAPATSISITGDNNDFLGGTIINPEHRRLIIYEGDSNSVKDIKYIGGGAPLDDGTNSVIVMEDMERFPLYFPDAPVKGYHRQGQIVYNTTPEEGRVVGWICIEGGTPGVWKNIGLIDVNYMVPLEDSDAETVLSLRTDFNNLLLRLRNAGLLKK